MIIINKKNLSSTAAAVSLMIQYMPYGRETREGGREKGRERAREREKESFSRNFP
jgi:hypothetical protein